MGTLLVINEKLRPYRWPFAFIGGAATVILLGWLRSIQLSFEPLQFLSLALFGSLLILTFAANALVLSLIHI